jgi:hypothetical protein
MMERTTRRFLGSDGALNESAGSTITLANFVEQKFEPEYVTALKHAGKLHYRYCLQNIIGALGTSQLRELGPCEISKFLKGVIDSGKSVQTATHFRNTLSVVFEHAKETGFYAGGNPARLVHLPATQKKSGRGALTFDASTGSRRTLPKVPWIEGPNPNYSQRGGWRALGERCKSAA